MKAIKFLLVAAMAAVATSAVAQDFNDPKFAKWGETADERKENILASSYLKEEVDNHNFNSAAAFLQQLLVNCPSASENIYANDIKVNCISLKENFFKYDDLAAGAVIDFKMTSKSNPER